MTNQEAFDRATIIHDTLTGGIDITIKFNSKNVEWIIKAAEALEMQIPKKPLHSGIFYDCPRCLETVGHKTPRGRLIADHHCKCGQSIYWGEE